MQESRPAERGREPGRGQQGRVFTRTWLWSVWIVAALGLAVYGTVHLIPGMVIPGMVEDSFVEAGRPGESRESQDGSLERKAHSYLAAPGGSAGRQESAEVTGRQEVVSTRLVEDRDPPLRGPIFRFFLAPRRPLVQGQVELYYHAMVSPEPGWTLIRLNLDGSNEMQMGPDSWPSFLRQIIVMASFGRSIRGRSKQFWYVKRTISLPVDGEPERPFDFVLQKREQRQLCKGSVLDERGQPIAACRISWGLPRPKWGGAIRPSSPQDPTLSSSGRLDLPGGDEDGSWFEPAADGSFEIWSAAGSRSSFFYLAVVAEGFAPLVGLRVQVGATAVRIVLERASTLDGSLLVPRDVDESVLRIALFLDGQALDAPSLLKAPAAQCRPIREGGRVSFHLGELAAGRYVLQVGYLSPHLPLIRVPGVEIQGGQDCRDLRVQNLNLMAQIRRIRLRVHTASGHALLSARIGYSHRIPVGGQVEGQTTVDGSGTAYVTIPSQGVDLLVTAPRMEALRVPGVKQDRDLVLMADTRPRVEVQIREALAKKVVGSLRLVLVLVQRPVGSKGASPDVEKTKKRPGKVFSRSYSLKGRFYFGRIDPGAYRVLVYVRGGSRSKGLPVQGNPIFRITRGSQKRVLTVSVDPLRLAEFVDESR